MAFLKSPITLGIGCLIMLCCVRPSFQQVCDRPDNLNPNVIITPDQPTYDAWYVYTASCPDGYTLSGTSGPFYCYSDGSWYPSPDVATCTVASVPCSKPTLSDSTVVITPNKTSYNTHDEVTASCPTGTLVGDDSAHCQPDGTWDFVSEPECKNDCGAPANTNGTGSYPHKSLVKFMCTSGSSLDNGEDSIETTCDDGMWNPPVNCELSVCDRPDNLNPNVIITPDQPTYDAWRGYIPSCPDGYILTGPSGYHYCYPDGSWYPSPDVATCTVASVPCSKPTLNDSTVVITPDKTSYNPYEMVTASCHTGTLVGDDSAHCQPDGTWFFTTEPECKSDCGVPANTNGTGSYPHTSVVTFMCTPGSSLDNGDDSIETTCDDGMWNPPVNCELFGCFPPSVPSKVIINYPRSEYDIHSRVTLMCEGNRTPSGPLFTYCNETGQWDPDPMTIKCCDQCATPSFADPRIVHTSDLSGSSGQDYYDHADTIRFSCEGGIFVDGPWQAYCRNGTWFPRIDGYRPVCKSNCTSPENMSNAGEIFHHSRVHTFECDGTPGLVRMGGPQSVCRDGVWTPRIRCDLEKNLRPGGRSEL